MIALAAALFTSTADVSALAAAGGTVWAATSGGVVEIDAMVPAVRRTYTTADGLDDVDVKAIVAADGAIHVRTQRSSCVLTGATFHCAAAPALPPPEPLAAPRHHGWRETARVEAAGRTFVATAGGGVFEDGRQVSGTGAELCGNHVEALEEFRGEVWVGTFDHGLCAFDGERFRRVAAPFRMVNDLRVTPRGLYVAAGEGLFVTEDGVRFRRERRVRERGANRLASDGRWLYATTPASLYAIRLDGRDVVRRFLRPAGSTALQAVAVSGRDVWLATEDRGVLRLRGDRFDVFDRASGLPSSWAVDVAPAPEGGVYVATLRHGTAHLSRDGRVAPVPGLDAWGLRLVRDGDGVLAGTQGGAARIVRGRPSRIDVGGDTRVHAFLRKGRSLFLGTETGLLRLDG